MAISSPDVFLSWFKGETAVFLLVGAFAFLWYGWMFTKSKKSGELPPPPGPKGLPLVGSLPFLGPQLHSYFAELARIYGPIVKLRLGNKVAIVVTSPSLAKEVLKDHDATFANRDVPVVARVGTYGGATIVWTPYGPQWRMLRKVAMQEMLGNTPLDAVYAFRQREVRQTLGYMYEKRGSPVKVGEQMFFTVLNVITSMLWGGTLKGEERDRLRAEFRQAVAEKTDLLGKPDVSDFFPALAPFDLQGLAKHMKKVFRKFDGIFNRVIDQRQKMMSGGDGHQEKDCVQFLLQLRDEPAAKNPLTMEQIKALLMDMVVGGTDTTSNTIEWMMAETINKPGVLIKAQEELSRVVGKDNRVEESHISQLPYLGAVMKEVLRLHPIVPLLVPHSPSQSCSVGGYTVPNGSRVFLNAWAIHRDPFLWDNPLDFIPERFLDAKWDYKGNDFRYFPFGSGRRMCVGTAMAERMVMFSVASLLHCFDWGLPEGTKLDLAEKFGIVLKMATPLVAIPTPRLSDPALYA